jgi:hypothetical protein
MAENQNWDLEKSGPAVVPEVVTPVDSADLTNTSRALYVGAAGNLKATFAHGSIVTIAGLLAGQVYPFALTKVFSGSTTAASMVALR